MLFENLVYLEIFLGSSVGSSNGLLIRGSQVRALPGEPKLGEVPERPKGAVC